VDGVQYGGVMPAAKLAADFLERGAGELPSEVHGDLPGKDVYPPIGTHGELRVSHLAHVELLAYPSADCSDCSLQCRKIKDHRCCRGPPLRRIAASVSGSAVPNDGT